MASAEPDEKSNYEDDAKGDVSKCYNETKKRMKFESVDFDKVDIPKMNEFLKDKDIKKISFDDCIFLDRNEKIFTKLFEQNNITHLKFRDSNTFSASRKNYVLTKIIKMGDKIVNLDLHIIVMIEEDVSGIFKVLEKHKSIKTVRLKFDIIDDGISYHQYKDSIKNMFKNNNTIESFVFQMGNMQRNLHVYNRNFVYIIDKIIKYFRFSKSITSLTIEPKYIYFRTQYTMDPYIDYNKAYDRDVHIDDHESMLKLLNPSTYHMKESLELNTTLKRLHFIVKNDNQDNTKRRLNSFVAGLKKNYTLKCLDLTMEILMIDDDLEKCCPQHMEEIEHLLERNNQTMIKSAGKR